MPATIQQHNERAASVWSAGGADYEEISRGIADAIEHCVRRLDPQPGERILDLSTGTGWTSRLLPRRGATVVGTDIASGLLDTAERRAREERLPIAYRVGDAEDLPFETGAFDAVTSTFGIMFAARPEAAAAELARVCRTGGRIAITTWLSDSTLVDMFAVMKHYMPPSAAPAPPSPFEWGRTDRIRELLGGAFRCASRRACRTTGSRTPRPPGRPSRKGTARRACWPRYSTPISARPCVRTSWRFTRGLPPISGSRCRASTGSRSASASEPSP